MSHLKSQALTVVVSVTLCLLATSAWNAVADQNPATDGVPRVVPYNGVMEFNGEAVTLVGTDAPWVQFNIYDGADINSSPIYVQRTQVEVRAGRFQALIGPTGEGNVAFEDVVLGADDLYMTLTLLGDPDNDADDVALSNPQRLLLSPHALYARGAADFDVANDLEVGRDVAVGRNVIVGNSLRVDGDIANRSGPLELADSVDITGGGSLSVDSIDSLSTINSGGGSFATGGDLTVGDGLVVSGATTLNGDIDAAGQSLDITDISLLDTVNSGGRAIDFGGDVTVNGQLNINDIATNANSDGCMRIGTQQMCWGIVRGDGSDTSIDSESFQRDFSSAPVVTLGAYNDSDDDNPNNLRSCKVRSLSSSSFGVKCYTSNDNNRDVDVFYTAFGPAGGGW